MDARTQVQQLKEQMDRGGSVSREQLDRLGDALETPEPAPREDPRPTEHPMGDPPAEPGLEEEGDDVAVGKAGSARRRR